MKKTGLFLGAFFALFFILLYACTKEEKETVGSIQGIVTNTSTNEPIQGVNISLSPTGLSTVTGSDGRYEFVNLQAGQYTVQALKEGYESNTKNITIVAGNVSSGDMTMKPELVGFKLNVEYLDFGANFSQLSFKVINTSTSLPVSWNITESINWLTATPSSGNLNAGQEAAVMVSIDRTQIEQSTTANLTVSGADQTVVLPVNVSVSGSQGPQLQLSETSLDFGTSANSLAFYVMNTGPAGTSLNWACSNINVDWLTVTPTSGNTDGGSSTAVMATIDRSKIDGMVSTSITISGAGSNSTITISAASEGAGAAILQLSEGSLDFGENETTKTFQVKNVGSTGTVLDWTIATPSVDWLTFSPMTGNTNAGSGTTVTAVVDRNKIHGSVSTTVTVTGSNNSANLAVLATSYHSYLEVPVTLVDFGKVSTTQTFQVKNIGDEGSVLAWNIASPSVDWLTISPLSGTINAGQSKTINLTIDRTKFDGDVSTTINITGGDQSATVSITASAAEATMSVPVTSIDFGKTSTQQTFQISNTGDEGSVLAWNIASPSVNWLMVSPLSGTINAGQSKTINLTIDRTKFDGDVSTTINITGGGQSATVSITASTAEATMSVPVTSIDFGKTSTQQTFQISNTGDEGSVLAWNIASPSVNWLMVSPLSGTINAGQSKTINLTIDRTKFDGDVSTTINITGGGQSATVSITASTPVATMSVSNTFIDFGTQSSQQTFEIRNTGEAGSILNWSIAAPSVNWLTVSPMTGSTNTTSPSVVTLIVDRNAFVGEVQTSITIAGAGTTATVSMTIDNRVLVTDGLMAYYTFDEGNVNDWGNNYNGINQGATTSSDVPGTSGFSMQFDGVSSYLSIPYVIIPTGTTWTLNLWFKTGSNARCIMATENYRAGLFFNASSKLYFDREIYDSWTTVNSINSYLNNQWHMLTITYNGSAITAYFDSVLFETKTGTYTWSSYFYGTMTYIGARMASSSTDKMYFNGKMDNIRTYNRALTQNEIHALYNAIQ